MSLPSPQAIFPTVALASAAATAIALIAIAANSAVLTTAIAATVALASAIAAIINNASDLISAIALRNCLGYHLSRRSRSHCLCHCCCCCRAAVTVATSPLSAGGCPHTSVVFFAAIFGVLIVDCFLPPPQLFALAAAHRRRRHLVCLAADAPAETGKCEGHVIRKPDEVLLLHKKRNKISTQESVVFHNLYTQKRLMTLGRDSQPNWSEIPHHLPASTHLELFWRETKH
jgi:hypothetical protein